MESGPLFSPVSSDCVAYRWSSAGTCNLWTWTEVPVTKKPQNTSEQLNYSPLIRHRWTAVASWTLYLSGDTEGCMIASKSSSRPVTFAQWPKETHAHTHWACNDGVLFPVRGDFHWCHFEFRKTLTSQSFSIRTDASLSVPLMTGIDPWQADVSSVTCLT